MFFCLDVVFFLIYFMARAKSSWLLSQFIIRQEEIPRGGSKTSKSAFHLRKAQRLQLRGISSSFFHIDPLIY